MNRHNLLLALSALAAWVILVWAYLLLAVYVLPLPINLEKAPIWLATVIVFTWVGSYWLVYGLFIALTYLAPFVLILAAIILGGLFVRKLVLDAVREARK